MIHDEPARRVSTGIAGLDEILRGGFIPGRGYLVRGGPGCGKTTLGLHFLTAGSAQAEQVLFITLAEPQGRLCQNAAAMGFDMQGVTFLDLSPTSDFFAAVESYDIFTPAEVEREPTTRKIIERIETLKPTRVFIDSMTQFRYLSPDPFHFRKQALSFLHFLADHGATVLFTAEGTSEVPDDDLQFMSDGVMTLALTEEGRSLSVTKFRGSGFRTGVHAVRLNGQGMQVFPQLMPEARGRERIAEVLPSGIPEMDEMLHGGLERGTVTVISGPSGVGKTTLGLQFMKEAAGRGEHSLVYLFEEGLETLLLRCDGINIPARTMLERGTLAISPVDPLLYTPDEFAYLVRRAVEEKRARIVMIDGVTGYSLSFKGGNVVGYLHALCKYLKARGCSVLLINETEAITGEFRATEVGISYLADNIIFMRYLEVKGQIGKAIGVLKKRVGDFEKALREIEITRYGIKVGKPLTTLRGILSGTPAWNDAETKA